MRRRRLKKLWGRLHELQWQSLKRDELLLKLDPATLWRYYMQLCQIEQAFKELKHDLAIRPIFHRRESRVEAHIFVAFIAYCLHVTLKNLARPHAPGPTPRATAPKDIGLDNRRNTHPARLSCSADLSRSRTENQQVTRDQASSCRSRARFAILKV